MWWRAALAWTAVVLLAGLAVAGLSRLYLPVSVTGASMSPALLPGDVVVVRRGRGARVGSIALLRARSGNLVLHRVIGDLGDGAVHTKGDANPIPDLEATPAGRVVGEVVRVIPVGMVLERWREASAYATLTAQQNSARR